jgi:hypothetical protein
VAQETLEALVDKQIAMLVTLPQGVGRIDVLGICQVKVADDGRKIDAIESLIGRASLGLDAWLPGGLDAHATEGVHDVVEYAGKDRVFCFKAAHRIVDALTERGLCVRLGLAPGSTLGALEVFFEIGEQFGHPGLCLGIRVESTDLDAEILEVLSQSLVGHGSSFARPWRARPNDWEGVGRADLLIPQHLTSPTLPVPQL